MKINPDLHRPHFATDKQWKEYVEYLDADVRPRRVDAWETMNDQQEIEIVWQPRITFIQWQQTQ